MDKIFISNQIKLEILRICGQSTYKAYNLPGNLILDILSYNDNEELCRELAFKLQEIALQYNTGKIILPDDVCKHHTVNDCIKMVFA